MKKLPTGWCTAPFSQVVESLSTAGHVVETSDIVDSGLIRVLTQGEPSQDGFIDDLTKAFTERTPLIVFGDHTRAVKLATEPFAVGPNAKVLAPRTGLSPRFLYHQLALLLPPPRGYGRHFQFLAKSEVTLAPEKEQERIVAAIEEQSSRLDTGEALLERVKLKLKRLRASVLQAAVTGDLVPHVAADVAPAIDQIAHDRLAKWQKHTKKPYKEPATPAPFPLALPPHWRIASLEALTDPVRVICYGILMPKAHVPDGVPYVRVKDMTGWEIDVAGLNRTSPDIAAKYARASLMPGDLLLAIRGSYGRVAIVPPELEGANITQDSARIAAHPAIDHRYLLYYLGGNVANRYYQSVARGVAVKGVNIGDLRAMPVPVPPLEEQVAIADEVERRFSFLDLLDAATSAQRRRASLLRSSILAAAFGGRLTSRGAADEPAQALLQRLAAEQGGIRPKTATPRRPHKGVAA